MAKKKEEIIGETAPAWEVDVVVDVKPGEIAADFGSEGLNALRDAVNWLLRR